ncbi:MAG: phosphoribosylglycinamide formyltransferase [Clostridiales bacterium]|nr:phosphoribosylglycinamide formyltransferase [Clostridiales bacterium]
MKKRIGVLVSGSGTNLQALIDAQEKIIKSGEIVLVISSKNDAFALKRAEKAGINTTVLARKDYCDSHQYSLALLGELKKNNLDVIVLAGFMSVLDECIPRAFENRIINVHPSLIPSFCGEGMYGLNVHRAALDYGVKITGATVHYVNEIVDGGKIIFQKAVEVLENDTPESLQKRVMEQAEWIILPQAVEKVCSDLMEDKCMDEKEKKLTDAEIYEKFIKNSDFKDVELVGRCCVDCAIDDIADIDDSEEDINSSKIKSDK